jgi:AcrR family transcriptional regulator
VSPARARTSIAQILAAGRDLLEAGGLDAVTMQAIAEQVGVRAPSLYKRFPSRAALIAAIGEAAFEDLHEVLAPLARDLDPASGLRAMAAAYRGFARTHPRTYELLFMNLPPDARPSAELNVLAAAPLLELAQRLVGSDRALDAARLVTAFAHGFVSMELSGAFRLGGDVDDAYRYGVGVLVDALATGRPADTASSDRSPPD